jgi:hypothetical protein
MNSQEMVEIPVRNLDLYMTVNPTSDLEKRAKFGAYTDPVKTMIAALSRNDYTIEESVFARWSSIVNLDSFPQEARVSTLVDRVNRAQRESFTSQPKLVLVAPEFLDQVVDAVPQTNAREFLQTATNAVLDISPDLPDASVYMVGGRKGPEPGADAAAKEVVLDDDDLRRGAAIARENGTHDPSVPQSAAAAQGAFGQTPIENYIKLNAVTRPVHSTHEYDGKLEFLSFMLENFRLLTTEHLLKAAQQSPQVSRTYESRKTFLAPLFLASVANFEEKGRIPMNYVKFRSERFGVSSRAEEDALGRAIDLMRDDPKNPFFPYQLSESKDSSYGLKEFLGRGTSTPQERSRADILVETTRKVRQIIQEAFNSYFRISSEKGLVEPAQWISSLTEQDQRVVFNQVGEKLVNEYLGFGKQLFEESLTEMKGKNPDIERNLNGYDISRLFLMCVDRAVTQLNWPEMTEFMLKVLALSKDLTYGQSPEFQWYLFDNPLSPFFPRSKDAVSLFASSSSDYRELEEAASKHLRTRYRNKCNTFLTPTAEPPKGDER